MKYKYWWMCRTKLNLLERYKSAHAIYDLSEKCLRQDGLLDARQADIFLRERKKADLDTAYQTFLQTGASFVTLEDTEYPYYLKEVFDAPYGMYVKGQIPQTKKIVAIVGARRCSAYGKKMAQELAYLLGKQGYVVISGMARGIDGIAQRAACEAGGVSFAVLGCGVDVCYPSQNQPLYDKLLETGGILSAYTPGTAPNASLFPPRNRIVSGLADAVVVVEARQKSGTLITVDMALEQGREVYVVPGRLTDRLSDGCNRLLKQGAGILLSPEEFVRELSEIFPQKAVFIKEQKKERSRKSLA